MQTSNHTSTPIVSVRVSAVERDLLEVAAQQAHTTLSDFVRRKALEAAEMDILDRRLVTIAAADWEKFERWAAAPPKAIPALRTLAATPLPWQG